MERNIIFGENAPNNELYQYAFEISQKNRQDMLATKREE